MPLLLGPRADVIFLFRRPLRRGATADGIRRMSAMRVGVIDVGANTLRLLVATRGEGRCVEPLREERRQLGLGQEIEQNDGLISADKLEEVAAVARTYVRRARKLQSDRIDVLVTSPGRQARNAEELVLVLRNATDAPVRILDAEEEGALAWRGATATADELPESVAVCDVGGGSTQIVVGTTDRGPAWTVSVDIGSLRLTQRTFASDPPSAADVAAAGEFVALTFANVTPPIPLAAMATGGTARGLRAVVGRCLDAGSLASATETLSSHSSREVAKEFRLDPARARTLLAGTLLLAEVQRKLRVPLGVARGGLREGAALASLDEVAAATA